jgi:large subunit ribosomal protein L15
MKLNEISDNAGSLKSRRRVGRGIGSSKGKTGGRGVKGQKSRSGVAINGFEGGQMPIFRRLPKRGFSNAMFTKDMKIISVGTLQKAVDDKKIDGKATITAEMLVEAGLLRRAGDGVRILSDGDIKAKLTCEVAGASKSAIEKIEKAGGSVTILAKPEAPKKSSKADA